MHNNRHSRFQRPSFPRTRESRERQSPPLVLRARRQCGLVGGNGCLYVFWIPASAGMTRVASGMTRVLIRSWDLELRRKASQMAKS